MENKQNFYPKERPMAREHEKIERDLNVHDKRKFGGMYYTDDATKLHVAVNTTGDSLTDQLAQQDVVFHHVKYSWEELNTLQAAIGTLFDKHGIHTSGFLPQKNCIYIGVDYLNEDIRNDIQRDMRGLGYDDEAMYMLVQEGRTAEPDSMQTDEEGEAATYDETGDEIERAANVVTTLKPGCLIQRRDPSTGTYHNMWSLNFAYVFNGTTYLVTAGHVDGKKGAFEDHPAYYVPPASGYPIVNVPTSFNAANRVKVGVFARQKYGGNFDFRSIRVTEPNLSFSHTAYNGWNISKVGGSVSVGALLRICGVTTRYNASYEYGKCDAIQVQRKAHDRVYKGLFRLNFGANNGTSGGPVITKDSNGDIRLVGIASSNGISQCWAIPVQYMMDTYNLSMREAGLINV